MDLIKNGNAPMAMVNISWVRDDFANGRRRYKAYAMSRVDGSNPVVIGEASIEVPSLEVAKIIHAAMAEMLAKQPPEIQIVGGARQ